MRNLLLHFSPDDGGGDPPGGDGGANEPPEGTPADPPGGSGEEETVPVAKFKEVQNEAKNLRKRLRDIEAKLGEKENEGKSEVEQTQTKLTETTERLMAAEKQSRELLVAVRAPKVGIVDGLVAARLIDFDKLEDPTDVDEVDKALKALVKEHPFLAGKVPGGADGGAGGGQGANATLDMNAEIRRQAGRSA